jgi:hypothetical protein
VPWNQLGYYSYNVTESHKTGYTTSVLEWMPSYSKIQETKWCQFEYASKPREVPKHFDIDIHYAGQSFSAWIMYPCKVNKVYWETANNWWCVGQSPHFKGSKSLFR